MEHALLWKWLPHNILALYKCMKDQCHPVIGLCRNQNTSVLPLAKLLCCLLFTAVSSYW